jgi:chemotaxis protein MotB
MTKLHVLFLGFVIVSGLLTSCVTQAEHAEVLDQVAYYKEQSVSADSISEQNRRMTEEQRLVKDDYGQVVREMESLKAANINLHRSYTEVLDRLNMLKYENDEVMAASSYENVGLQESVAEMRGRLDVKERELAKLEYELYQKESRLNRGAGAGAPDSGAGYTSEGEFKFNELEAATQAKKEKLYAVYQSLLGAVKNYTPEEINMTEKNGRLHISLGQNLLFGNGEENVSWDGKTALREISDVLTKNRDLDISVVGHTNSNGIASRNWDLSVIRATAVVKVLSSYGVAPESITASGRGFYAPVASNVTASGKTENARTEIVLSPDLDELYRMIDKQ